MGAVEWAAMLRAMRIILIFLPFEEVDTWYLSIDRKRPWNLSRGSCAMRIILRTIHLAQRLSECISYNCGGLLLSITCYVCISYIISDLN